MQRIYRMLHAHPQLSGQTADTAVLVGTQLAKLGLEVEYTEDGGLIATLQGGQGKTVALRAELDALPINEQTALPYTSENPGQMHACGHDFHAAALIGAAALLAEQKESLKGSVQFIFQSDEEEDGVAALYTTLPQLKDTAAVFGAHVDPTLPAGSFGIKSGVFYASAAKFNIEFIGKSAHGALPHNGIDALDAAARTVPKLLALRRDGDFPVMVSVGTFHSGTARNIIADRATLTGIVRCADPNTRRQVHTEFLEILRTCEAEGVTVNLKFTDGYPGVTNPPRWAEFVTDVAVKTFGEQRVVPIDKFLMTTEDFGEYLKDKDGCFYHIGVGGDEGLHSSRFAPDPALLKDAALLHATIVKNYLEID